MKIIVFGATGGTGRQLIQQAIAAGCHVVAYARNPSKIDTESERLTIVKGDLSNEELIGMH
jgi:putative NADH-flavin reductase